MAHLGNTVVNGALRVIGGENVDTINGVTVGSSPKFTDTRKAFACTCASAADAAAKVVSLNDSTGWELRAGVIIGVKFTNGNTASSVTLNVNGSNAKSIFYDNAVFTGSTQWITGQAGRYIYYQYDGTYWVWMNIGRSLDSNTAVTQTATTTSANYEVLFSVSADNTTRTEGARKNNNLLFNPSTGNLQATQLNGVTIGSSPKFTDTTYTFAGGTNKFTVTPSGGNAQDVTITPSITNNVTGSGTSGYIAKFNGANTITNGPAIGSDTTKYLRNDGSWAVPVGTTYNFSGSSFISGDKNTSEHNANNVTTNGTYYYTSNGPAQDQGATTNDGALYAQAHTSSWIGQIAQDYRDGDLFVRGKNNGSWTVWKKVIDFEDAFGLYYTNNVFIFEPKTRKIQAVNATTGWNKQQVYSSHGYQTCYLSFKAGQTNKAIMIGISKDPSLDAHYTSLDYAWYIKANGTCSIYENGTNVWDNSSTYNEGGIFTIEISNTCVRYEYEYSDGSSATSFGYTSSNKPNAFLYYFDSSFYDNNAYIYEFNFGRAQIGASRLQVTNDTSSILPTSSYCPVLFGYSNVSTCDLTSVGIGPSSFFGYKPAKHSLKIGEGSDTDTATDSLAHGYYVIATGSASHAEGRSTSASGGYSHAEGVNTSASGGYSHAEGYYTSASGGYSHTEGSATRTSGNYSHSEGANTLASGGYSHAEGNGSSSSADGSHAEGHQTIAGQTYAHTEGQYTRVLGSYAHAEGNSTSAGVYAHSEGKSTCAAASTSHAEGNGSTAAGTYAHAEGANCYAGGSTSHVEGYFTTTTNIYSHAEGKTTCAANEYAHAEGLSSKAAGSCSHAEGSTTCAAGAKSHAESWSTTAYGECAHSEGRETYAISNASHTEGYKTTTNGNYSHAEGVNTSTNSESSHAEGNGTVTSAAYAHAEGINTSVLGSSGHAEGASTCATGSASHSEGKNSTTIGSNSHAEGTATISNGESSHAEGRQTTALNNYSHAEGLSTSARGNYSHAEGHLTSTYGSYNHSEGGSTLAGGDSINYSHAEGYNTTAAGSYSHAEGGYTKTSNSYAHAEGRNSLASGIGAHTEGFRTTASGICAHAEGGYTTSDTGGGTRATANNAHSEGFETRAIDIGAHSEGFATNACADYSHAEGTATVASGDNSHAEGGATTTVGNASHAEGNRTKTQGVYAHAEGQGSTAFGSQTHAEGYFTSAIGATSHTEGAYTSSQNLNAHASGHYNAAMTAGGNATNTTGTAFVIGNGTAATALKNAFSVQFNGVVKAASTVTASTTADYAEYFEWADENPNNEDRVGYFVTFDSGDKIKIGSPEDEYILGIVSGEPFVLGNGDCDVWNGMVMRDAFRRTIYEPAPKYEYLPHGEAIPVKDKDGKPVYEGTKPKYNPNYDPTQPYINRADRPEWSAVGMLGVLAVRDNGQCQVNSYCTIGQGGIAVPADINSIHKYRVIKRNATNVVEVVFR